MSYHTTPSNLRSLTLFRKLTKLLQSFSAILDRLLQRTILTSQTSSPLMNCTKTT